VGGWKGLVGNSTVFGIEAEHTGKRGVPWPTAQLDAMQRLSAQLSRRSGFDTGLICGHKEWAPSRKIDPIDLNMDEMREAVAAILWMEDNMATFTDVPETHWAYNDVEWAAANKIVTGYTGQNAGKFGPEDTLTRAQMAAVIRRAVRLLDPSKA
jgi:N-acetyl-anhydromuramyl-L-alanine amidase AmpD